MILFFLEKVIILSSYLFRVTFWSCRDDGWVSKYNIACNHRVLFVFEWFVDLRVLKTWTKKCLKVDIRLFCYCLLSAFCYEESFMIACKTRFVFSHSLLIKKTDNVNDDNEWEIRHEEQGSKVIPDFQFVLCSLYNTLLSHYSKNLALFRGQSESLIVFECMSCSRHLCLHSSPVMEALFAYDKWHSW